MPPVPKTKTTYGKAMKGKAVRQAITVLLLKEEQENEMETDEVPKARPVPKIRHKGAKAMEGERKVKHMSRINYNNVVDQMKYRRNRRMKRKTEERKIRREKEKKSTQSVMKKVIIYTF
jgi:hypothetical protein